MWRIRDWDNIYESSETRKIRRLSYVLVPNKHDGKGFRRIAKRQDAAEVYAAWILMLQVASKSPNRGVLADNDGELTEADLADKTGFPEQIFANALKVLSDKSIGWIEDVLPGDHPGTPGHAPVSSGLTVPYRTVGYSTISGGGPVAGFCGTWDSEAWQKAMPLCARAHAALFPNTTRLKQIDREIIGKAALVAVLIYSESWFTAALDGIDSPEIKKPVAVWKSRLSKQPESEGRTLQSLLDIMVIPKRQPVTKPPIKEPDDAKPE